jgi:hypothetical protein
VVWKVADEYGCTDAVALGLSLAQRLGAVLPPAEAVRVAANHRAYAEAEAAWRGLFVGDGDQTRARRKFRTDMRTRTARGRLKYLASLGHPSERDFAFVRLPHAASFLYYAVRPIRIAYDHTIGRRRRYDS